MTDRALDDDKDAEAEETQDEAPKSRFGGKRRLLMFGGAGLLVIAATGGVLYFTGIAGKLMGSKPAETADASAPAPPPPSKPSVFFDLPDLLVNLNSTGRKASFLKISVSLDLEDQADTARIQAVMPRIIDNFQVYLRELRVEDLRGSGGIYRLREELLARVNAAASPVKVKDVLFKEMLVQ